MRKVILLLFVSCLLAMVLLSGCATKDPLIKYEVIEVMVPIEVMATPPAELLAPIEVATPVFISPADPEASSALSVDNEERLKRLILDYYDRELAWRAWSGG